MKTIITIYWLWLIVASNSPAIFKLSDCFITCPFVRYDQFCYICDSLIHENISFFTSRNSIASNVDNITIIAYSDTKIFHNKCVLNGLEVDFKIETYLSKEIDALDNYMLNSAKKLYTRSPNLTEEENKRLEIIMLLIRKKLQLLKSYFKTCQEIKDKIEAEYQASGCNIQKEDPFQLLFDAIIDDLRNTNHSARNCFQNKYISLFENYLQNTSTKRFDAACHIINFCHSNLNEYKAPLDNLIKMIAFKKKPFYFKDILKNIYSLSFKTAEYFLKEYFTLNPCRLFFAFSEIFEFCELICESDTENGSLTYSLNCYFDETGLEKRLFIDININPYILIFSTIIMAEAFIKPSTYTILKLIQSSGIDLNNLIDFLSFKHGIAAIKIIQYLDINEKTKFLKKFFTIENFFEKENLENFVEKLDRINLIDRGIILEILFEIEPFKGNINSYMILYELFFTMDFHRWCHSQFINHINYLCRHNESEYLKILLLDRFLNKSLRCDNNTMIYIISEFNKLSVFNIKCHFPFFIRNFLNFHRFKAFIGRRNSFSQNIQGFLSIKAIVNLEGVVSYISDFILESYFFGFIKKPTYFDLFKKILIFSSKSFFERIYNYTQEILNDKKKINTVAYDSAEKFNEIFAEIKKTMQNLNSDSERSYIDFLEGEAENDNYNEPNNSSLCLNMPVSSDNNYNGFLKRNLNQKTFQNKRVKIIEKGNENIHYQENDFDNSKEGSNEADLNNTIEIIDESEPSSSNSEVQKQQRLSEEIQETKSTLFSFADYLSN